LESGAPSDYARAVMRRIKDQSLPDTIGSSRGPSVAGASPQLLRELLQLLETEMRTAGAPVASLLRPGATRSDIQREFHAWGLVAPEEAIVLLQWHDGRYDPGGWWGLPVFPAWSLEYLAAARRRRGRTPEGFGEWEWNPNWMHIMGDGFGLAMCCADEPESAPLIRFHDGSTGTQEWQTETQVVSLCTPVTWWIDSIRRGWYWWDKSTQEWKRNTRAQPLYRTIYQMS
jgi:hypothetical protein